MEIIGRQEELAAMARFLDAASTEPQAFLFEGEAGIGKTTLWREGVRAAHDAGRTVLECRPVEAENRLSFAALAERVAGW